MMNLESGKAYVKKQKWHLPQVWIRFSTFPSDANFRGHFRGDLFWTTQFFAKIPFV